jgi:hypothetical protein
MMTNDDIGGLDGDVNISSRAESILLERDSDQRHLPSSEMVRGWK